MKARGASMLLGLLLIVSLVSSACGGSPSQGTSGSESEPASGQMGTPADTFVVATAEDIPGLDPASAQSNTVFREVAVMYDRLVTIAGDSTKVQPQLATDWKVSDDGLTYTFHLNPAAKFHDGSPVDAEAVKYSISRQIQMAKIGSHVFDGILKPDGIKVVDPTTVEFHLEKPYAPFVNTLATTWGGIVNPAIAKAHETNGDFGEAWVTEHDAGSGPYKLVSFTRGQQVELAAVDHYWGGGDPSIKRVLIKIVPEASTRRLMLERGEADLTEELPADVLEKLRSENGIELHEQPEMRLVYIMFNAAKPPFDNPDVRKAFSEAINYDAIIRQIYLGHAIRARGPVPKGMLGWSEQVPVPSYNLDDAKKLLQKAGVQNLTVEFSTASGHDDWDKIALLLQSDLSQIGVTMKVQQYAWSTYLDKLVKGEFQFGIINWTPDYADPDYNSTYMLDSKNKGEGYNFSLWGDPRVDALLQKGRETTDEAQRQEIYTELQTIAAENTPYAWVAQTNAVVPTRSWVKAYVINPMNSWFIDFAKISKQP